MSAFVPLKILVVGDGYQKYGINFLPTQDPTNCGFTITEFLYLLGHSTGVAISADTASRDPDPSAQFPNFVFTDLSLAKYTALLLFGYDGLDDGQTTPTPGSQPLTDDERLAIFRFMNRGGGVFATGDHSGLGSFMCGNIPRVRSMRKWFNRAGDCPPDRTTALDLNGLTVSMVNWPGLSTSQEPGGLSRADTLRMNPSDQPNAFDFDNQSDGIPQELNLINEGHGILTASNGSFINRFPDHMHEGEVVTPVNNVQMTVGSSTFVEFPPAYNGYYPMPQIVAGTVALTGHSVQISGNPDGNCAFSGDGAPSVGATYGAVCVYDGLTAGVGNIVTDASFHHYLDLNLIGNPLATTADRRAGFGPAYTTPEAGSILDGLQQFYTNVAGFLGRPPKGIACSNQFGVGVQTDVIVTDASGDLMVHWAGPDGNWNGPSAIAASSLFIPGGAVTVAGRAGSPDRTDAFAIDSTGAIQVFSASSGSPWQPTETIGGAAFVPGGAIAVSPQWGVPGQTDVFSVDSSGQLRVSWTGADSDSWQPPQPAGTVTNVFAPGVSLAASNRFGVVDQTDVFAIDTLGSLCVVSVLGTGAWGELVVISNGSFYPASASVAASNRFGIPTQTDVFAVSWAGALTVSSSIGGGAWSGPNYVTGIGAFPSGAPLAVSNQFGLPDQTDVFAIDCEGALTVTWVGGDGNWNGPSRISAPLMFFQGGAVAACQEFGTEDVTLVFAITRMGAIVQFRVQGAGAWSGPVYV